MSQPRFEDLIEKARAASRDGDTDLALTLYTEVISHESLDLSENDLFQVLRARVNRGVVSFNQGESQKALQDWNWVAYELAVARSEWLDRIRIRALRNLALLEKLPPPQSPHLRHALQTFCDSEYFSVHKVLFEAALESTWIYDPDGSLITFVRSLAGKKGAVEDLALVWTTLNRDERQKARAWWGKEKERQFTQILESIGPAFEDEAAHRSIHFRAPMCKINDNPYGRGGIKALFLGRQTLGWLTCDHRVEFKPDRRHHAQLVRHHAWSEEKETLALVGDEKRHRIDIVKPSGMEKILSRRPVTGLAWGRDLGWVDEDGFFKGTQRVDSAPLQGLVFWNGSFWTWNPKGIWEIREPEGQVFKRGSGGDWVLTGKSSLAQVSGNSVFFRDEVGHEWTIHLSAQPEKGALGPKRMSAWVVQGALIVYDQDTQVRKWEGIQPTALSWVSNKLLVGSQDWSFRVIDLSGKVRERVMRHHTDWVTDFAYDKSNGNLYVSSLDGQVSVWDFGALKLRDIYGQKGALRLYWGDGWHRLGLSWAQGPKNPEILGFGDPWLSQGMVGGGLHLLSLSGEYLFPGGRTTVSGTQGFYLLNGKPYFARQGRLEDQAGKGWNLLDPEDWITAALQVGDDFALGSAKGSMYRLFENDLAPLSYQHLKAVQHLVVLPRQTRYPACDSTTFVASTGEDGRLLVWDWDHLRALEILKTGGSPLKGLLSCGRILVGWDGSPEIQAWGVPGSSGHWEVKAHAQGVAACVADPQGRYLISAGRDGEVKAWMLPDLRLLSRVVRLDEPITALAWRSVGQLGVLGYSGEITEIDLDIH